MMKNILILATLFFAVIACKTDNKVDPNKNDTSEISEIPLLVMGEFDNKAGEFVDKEIKIQGIVDHVCKHSGKKLLVVTDDGQVHVTSDVRFDDTLKGSEILLNGIVLEERIDEAYCLKMEEDNIKSHSEGSSNSEQFENKKKHIQQYRDKMKNEKLEYVSEFSIKYVSHTEIQ